MADQLGVWWRVKRKSLRLCSDSDQILIGIWGLHWGKLLILPGPDEPINSQHPTVRTGTHKWPLAWADHSKELQGGWPWSQGWPGEAVWGWLQRPMEICPMVWAVYFLRPGLPVTYHSQKKFHEFSCGSISFQQLGLLIVCLDELPAKCMPLPALPSTPNWRNSPATRTI